MLNPTNSDAPPPMELRGSALVASKQDGGRGSQSKEKDWCDYCNKPYHTHETC